MLIVVSACMYLCVLNAMICSIIFCRECLLCWNLLFLQYLVRHQNKSDGKTNSGYCAIRSFLPCIGYCWVKCHLPCVLNRRKHFLFLVVATVDLTVEGFGRKLDWSAAIYHTPMAAILLLMKTFCKLSFGSLHISCLIIITISVCLAEVTHFNSPYICLEGITSTVKGS